MSKLKRVIVIGSPGAGKSHFAKILASKTSLPLYHLDMIWHKPDKTHISREEFDTRLEEICTEDEWIIDGNYKRSLETRFDACDTVFLLDFPTEVCIEGASARIGTRRDDLPWCETELDPEFKSWIESFRTEQTPIIYALIEKYRSTKDIHIFKTRNESDEYLKNAE